MTSTNRLLLAAAMAAFGREPEPVPDFTKSGQRKARKQHKPHQGEREKERRRRQMEKRQ